MAHDKPANSKRDQTRLGKLADEVADRDHRATALGAAIVAIDGEIRQRAQASYDELIEEAVSDDEQARCQIDAALASLEAALLVLVARTSRPMWDARWARSPMAARFTEVDWDRLRFVVAPLFDRFLRSSSKELASELRLQGTLLGATLMDRQRMGLRIDDPGPAMQPPNDELQAEFDELLAKRMAGRGR